jgi:hypothetical protein
MLRRVKTDKDLELAMPENREVPGRARLRVVAAGPPAPSTLPTALLWGRGRVEARYGCDAAGRAATLLPAKNRS